MFFQYELDVGERRGTRNWIAAEGGEVITGLEGGGNLVARGEGCQRETVGDAFGGDEDVRLDPVMFDGEHLASTAEAGLYLVADKENGVAVENFLDLAKIVGRRNDDAALAQHGFGDEGRYVARGREADDVFQRLAPEIDAALGIVRPRRAVNVRCGREGHTGRVGTAAFFTSLIAGDGERAPGASVKRCLQGDDLVFAAVEPRNFHCAFDGLGATVGEERFAQR